MRRMYSRQELVNIIKENLENGSLDIKAKTLEQSKANEELTLSISGLNGLTLDEKSYYKAEIINGVLWLIAQVKVSNNTESAISATNINFACIVPSKYAKKIYKTDGYTIDEYVSGQDTLIARDIGLADQNVKPVTITCTAKDNVTFYIQTNNIGAGYYNQISIRIPLILL